MSSYSLVTNDLYSYMDEERIHELLKCKICKKPFVNPVSTDNGDTFCRVCIVSILNRHSYVRNISFEESSSNENDQQAAKMQRLIPVTEKLVFEMLDSLLVRCTKCGLINIKRGLLLDHENTSCMQATVQCNAVDIKCKWTGARDELDEHMEECKFEPLRPAFDFLFNENVQLKNQLEALEAEIAEQMVTRGIQGVNLDP